jgi:ABC-type uncharacterized transport system substrate-binding protein
MPQIEIGFLYAATDAAWKPYYDAFKSALTPDAFHINTASTKGDPSQYGPQAKYLAGIPNIKIIVTAGTEATAARMTEAAAIDPNIAVVFASAGDPLACGLVNSLNAPTGTDSTGCSNMQTDDTTVQNRG